MISDKRYIRIKVIIYVFNVKSPNTKYIVQILGLANLTALLETAIAAEKAARTSLQKFVNSIKDQVCRCLLIHT